MAKQEVSYIIYKFSHTIAINPKYPHFTKVLLYWLNSWLFHSQNSYVYFRDSILSRHTYGWSSWHPYKTSE